MSFLHHVLGHRQCGINMLGHSRAPLSLEYCRLRMECNALQGGKGCRDPRMLDRRDRRAGKQHSSKTQSQKHKRVGLAAKQQRDRAAHASGH